MFFAPFRVQEGFKVAGCDRCKYLNITAVYSYSPAEATCLKGHKILKANFPITIENIVQKLYAYIFRIKGDNDWEYDPCLDYKTLLKGEKDGNERRKEIHSSVC